MSEAFVVAVNVSVTNGPTLLVNQTLTVDAYDKFDVAVPDGTTDMAVQLLPANSGTVKFMALTSDLFDENLSYKVNTSTDARQLDGPHLLIGAGAVGLLDPTPETLVFNNTSGKNAQVRILIGRDAA